MLHKFEPRKRVIDVKRTAPLTHSMEEFFEDFPPRRWMETLDREKELIVRAELPGVEKDDVEVTIAGDRLTIEAEREFEEEETKETFYRHELGYGELRRTIALPVEIDAEHIKAELQDGILSVILPKVQAATRHTVKVA
jgi:HSP20 family protein